MTPGSNDHCWVSDSTGEVSGPAGQVPLITAPPPPQQVASPANFIVENKTCTPNGYIVSLNWDDIKEAQGYRVYRDNQQIASLSAKVSAYDDTPPDFYSHSYYVQAYNASSSANNKLQNSTGCLH